MSSHPPFRRVVVGIAPRDQIPLLRTRYERGPSDMPPDSDSYAGEWFEVDRASFEEALGSMPPLFMRNGMFALSEFKIANVTSVFFSIRFRTRERWFHGFCDLSFPGSPEAMRAAIIAHETNAFDSMTREEKLELIWNETPEDYRGHAGSLNPGAWPPRHRGKRTILINGGGVGTILTLLEDLSEEEIDELLVERHPLAGTPKAGRQEPSTKTGKEEKP